MTNTKRTISVVREGIQEVSLKLAHVEKHIHGFDYVVRELHEYVSGLKGERRNLFNQAEILRRELADIIDDMASLTMQSGVQERDQKDG